MDILHQVVKAICDSNLWQGDIVLQYWELADSVAIHNVREVVLDKQ